MDGIRVDSLAPFTTLRVGGPARLFYTVRTTDELSSVLAQHPGERPFILGGGSNILVSDDGISRPVLKMETRGVTYEEKGSDAVRVTAAAGENWDMLVAETVSRGLSGLENLSDIPGVVGASPVQNIGAYGVEVKDVIESVEVLDMRTRGLRTLAPEECAFGYRDSIFKHDEGKPFIVTNVSFSLSPVFHPNIAYKDLTEYFATRAAPSSSREVRDAVCTVRAAKFPDLSVLGTAGSFFKNPVLSTEVKEALAAKYPDIPSFPAAPGWYKVPLAWILDHVLHVNGFRSGNVSLFEKQPLVLVAHTGATAREIDDFARDIEKKVFDATHIEIEREVQSVS